jgi:hypothetical protein
MTNLFLFKLGTKPTNVPGQWLQQRYHCQDFFPGSKNSSPPIDSALSRHAVGWHLSSDPQLLRKRQRLEVNIFSPTKKKKENMSTGKRPGHWQHFCSERC